ncbi:hypothetical protein [Polaribacter sp. Hel1_85]|uniref:hypothetical protein n=1 Tax=Polaribacter sp. Hel1_85 TaxID=1250005 RepID=UPI00052DA3E6|nr:hypothetical protein [Polaribacter sp. Hel1_85]KGL62820.1 conserved hypothetical protein, Acyl-CoA N-acyltransferase domain protein [Polaribacter sp. Hel1_85]
MIEYIKRKNLNVEKYDACIENSIQSRIYAFSWYLDIVADNWDVLVLDNYKAVMPIPWRKKFFIKYVSQPYFCQQLGVFSKEIVSEALQEKMINHIPKKFVKISLNFNSGNFLTYKMNLKNNYLLKIEKKYENNYKKFTKNRKRDLKKAMLSTLTFEENLGIKEFYGFYLLNDKNFRNYISMKEVLQNILKLNSNVVRCFGIRSKECLVASVLLLDNGKRITYLVPVSNDFGKKNGASTLLITEIIKKYKRKNCFIDFEGSMITGVAKFYKSFGSDKESYSVLTKSIF